MPLVDMKSNLSQITTNFGSDTTTAGRTNSFAFDSLNTATLPRTLYLDIKGDFPSLFSPTNKAYPNQRTFSIDTTNYTDIKGDTTSLFSPTNRAVPNFYNTGDQPTPLQQISTTGINGLTNYGINSNRYGFSFIPPFSDQNKFPSITPTQSAQSRLFSKHTTGKNELQNAGFTRNAIPLDNYYAQANNDNGILGQRNDGLPVDSQPYVTRNIGQRWGINTTETTSVIKKLAKIPLRIVKELSADVFGRDVTVFGDRFIADKIRLANFANPLSTYVIQQNILQRKNKYSRVASVLYGKIQLGKVTLNNSPTRPVSLSNFDALNPQVYNVGSVFSTPGVPGLMFHRMGSSSDILANFDIKAFKAAANVAYAGAQITGILGQYSARAISISAPVAANVISSTIGGLGNILVGAAKGLSNPLAGASNPLAGISNPFAGVSNPLAGISNPFAGASNPLAGVSNPLAGIGNPLAGMSNPFAGASIKGLAGKLPDVDLSAAKRILGGGVDAIGRAATKARDVAKDVLDDIGPLPKFKLMQLDAKAFGDIGVDKLNLIPFGKDDYEGVSYDRLDWIPFKFTDLVDNKPIVFRAVLSGITDSFTPEFASTRYMGRPDNVYVYQGTTREISFSFDVHPNSAEELFIIWEKLNYLAGQTYPHWSEPSQGGGRGMISPMTGLTIGDMYRNAPGIITSLTYTVQDQGNWEVEIGKLPKYIQVACAFTYIGNELPASKQKHFDLPRIPKQKYQTKNLNNILSDIIGGKGAKAAGAAVLGSSGAKNILKKVGL